MNFHSPSGLSVKFVILSMVQETKLQVKGKTKVCKVSMSVCVRLNILTVVVEVVNSRIISRVGHQMLEDAIHVLRMIFLL